jgi:amino acid transporter
MVVLMILWGGATILMSPDKQRLPPAPTPQHLLFNNDAVGWMPRLMPKAFEAETPASQPEAPATPSAPQAGPHYKLPMQAGSLLGLIGILIAFGHSILAMSGEETLAQVNRELEYPKHKNLMRAGLIIFVYSLLFTSFVSFFAYALIPDGVRSQYFDNLISGIAMNLAGPFSLRLAFQAYVVLVGFLLLSSAVNTAIIGSNAIFNRISEDGVLTPWFRAPHKRFGTTYRTINLIAILQIVTIVLSRGEVYVLGEAYAFGVIWSFAFNALSMLVLRFKDRSPREWKVPFNLTIKGREIPFGLGGVALILFTLAGINLVTKQVATVSGLLITATFSAIFFISERLTARRATSERDKLDQFRLQPHETIAPESVSIRSGCTLVPVRDYNNLDHVRQALDATHTGKRDLVVMTVHTLRGPHAGYRDLNEDRLFTDYEQLLFSRVVALAEKAGKHVDLMVVPSPNPLQAIVHAAAQLHAAEIILGRSAVMEPSAQALQIGEAWERLTHKPRHQVQLRVFESGGVAHDFVLGAHPPKLDERDVLRIHSLWLDVKAQLPNASVRHRDIVTVAVQRLATDLNGVNRMLLLAEIEAMKKAEKPSQDTDADDES